MWCAKRPLQLLRLNWRMGLLGLALSTAAQAASIQSVPTPQQADALLAPPPNYNNLLLAPQSNNWQLAATPSTGWTIDTNNRQLVRAFYNSVYLSSLNVPIGWTGNHSTCTPGTTSTAFKNAVLARINYYRAMAGVPANVVFDATNNAKAQQAALMMSVNNTLNHYPPTTWRCYTAAGREAAANSNLSLGHNAWNAVDGQIRDNGTNNTAAGHRRWLLLPQAQIMGTGDVPSVGSGATYLPPANSLWVPLLAKYNPRPATRDPFVAWPTRGFNPYTIVPVRWSFSYPNANFANAVITMSSAGQAIPLTVDSRVNGYGENTIVWRPYNRTADTTWHKPSADTAYQVTIRNVLINGVATQFSYTVTVIDPAVAAVGEPQPSINGSTKPTAGASNSYSFNTISIAQYYDAYRAESATATELFNAETGSPAVTAGNSSTYTLVYSGTGSNGTKVYRLAPASASETFTLPMTYLPTATSALIFDSKLGYATNKQTAAVQISTNNGASWVDLYAKTGSGSGAPEENAFSTKTIALSAYANKLVSIRVVYRHSGSYYVGTTPNVSFLVDNLRLTNAKKVINPTTLTNRTGTFSFVPTLGKSYIMAARAVPWLGYPGLDWGPLLFVTPVLGTPSSLTPSTTSPTRTPTYSWRAVPNATHYVLYVSDITQQGKIQTTYTPTQTNCATGTTCTVTPTTAVSGNVSWKVQAKAGTTTGAWSTIANFVAPPDKTSLISPVSASLTKTPTYSWRSVPGATHYYLWVDNGGVSGKIKTWYTSAQVNCATGTTCSIKPATLVSGAATWKVQTKNSAGVGAWSTSGNFTAP